MALSENGAPVFASMFSENEWEKFKGLENPLTMPCCGARAILKTSINGNPFFSHQTDECASSPETVWHRQAKEIVALSIKQLGFSPQIELPGGSVGRRWVADVAFEAGGRSYAIEIQHSYQHLREYLARQQRYREENVNAVWILYKPRFLTLSNSIMKWRYRNEFNKVNPSDPDVIKGMNQIHTLATVWLEPDDEKPIHCPGLKAWTLHEWIPSIIDGSFSYDVDGWSIRNSHRFIDHS